MIDPPWVLDDLPVAVWVGNVPDGTPAYANKMFERIMGMPAANVTIENIPETYGVFDREGRRYAIERLPFARVVATRGPVVVDDIVIRRAGGDVNIRVFGSPVFASDGTLTHVILAFIDITKEIATDVERRMVEERLRFVCNHAPIAIWMTDVEGVVTLSEGAGLASLGVKSGELVGKNLLELYGAHPTIPGYIRRGLAGESFWYTVEVGEAVYETFLTPLRDAIGKMLGMAGLSNDVSQLRKLQRTAIQNDRVMALGTLAASVAHEINNPLTYVLTHGDGLSSELDVLDKLLAGPGAPKLDEARASVARLREGLGPIRSGTNRIASITRDLRSFSRPDERSLAPVNLRAVVESVLKLVAKEVEARARLVLDLRDCAPVVGNEARLIQVVLNLIVNAYQALPPDSPGYHQVAVSVRNDGGRVVVEVSDSGPGVPAADRERIFEPFFSTKEIGIGTGLGLFVCRNIVRGFSGEVELGDRPGGGAVFRVVLPAAVPVVPTGTPALAVADKKAGGAHIVLIEDDRLVARAFSLQLGQAGYRVTTFGDAQSGMRALLELTDVDLVFCDLMMTGMTGMDLTEDLTKLAPEKAAKLVLMTGGAFSARARDFVARHRDRTVDKPFDIVAETQRRLSAPTTD